MGRVIRMKLLISNPQHRRSIFSPMKNRLMFTMVFIVITGTFLAAEELTDRLQRGLLEEEANLNYPAAITNYQEVVRQSDAQRRVVATAIFRLAECYRKLGQTHEARAYYERVLRDFSDQPNLVALSQQHVGPASLASREPSTHQPSGEDAELLRLQKLLETSPDLINAPDDDGLSLLSKAAAQGQVRVAEFLLSKGAEINRKGRSGKTPLMDAVGAGHKALVERLLERGADIHARSANHITALHIAASSGFTLLIKTLLDHQAGIDAQDDTGRTPLIDAISKKEQAAAVTLLEAKANPRLLVKNGHSALSYAAMNGLTHLVSRLVEAGAEVNPAAPALNPLRQAIMANQMESVLWLLDHGASVSQADIPNDSIVVLALEKGSVDAAMALIRKGANVNNPGPSFLREKVRIGGQSPKTAHALHYAAADGRMDLLQLLLDHQANVNAPDSISQAKPLHYAVWNNQTNVIPVLIQKGASTEDTGGWNILPVPNTPGSPGRRLAPGSYTPIGMAIAQENAALVDLLLSHGVDPKGMATESTSILFWAANLENAEVLKAVLAHKPSLVQTNLQGYPVLWYSVDCGLNKTLRLLLETGADPNASFRGVPSLSQAVYRDNFKAAQMLLTHGANPNIMGFVDNWATHSPLSLVQLKMQNLNKSPSAFSGNRPSLSEYQEMEALLLKHGASEFLARRQGIHLDRPDWDSAQLILRQSTNDWNRFTLLELLAVIYSGTNTMTSTGPGNPSRSFYAFPDFKRITINRILPGDKATTNLVFDAEARLRKGLLAGDLLLEWGDKVRLPEADHLVQEQWEGLTEEALKAFQNHLKRQVKVSIKDQVHELILVPTMQLKQFPSRTARERGPVDLLDISVGPSKPTNQVEVADFWIGTGVQQAKILRASSDQSRIKVKRCDPETGQDREFIMDLTQADPKDTIWLRDGDVIEVPER